MIICFLISKWLIWIEFYPVHISRLKAIGGHHFDSQGMLKIIRFHFDSRLTACVLQILQVAEDVARLPDVLQYDAELTPRKEPQHNSL